MTQHHFVVMYDTNTKEWNHEAEVESANFPDGTIYNDEVQEWIHYNKSSLEEFDEQLLTRLNNVLATLNKKED